MQSSLPIQSLMRSGVQGGAMGRLSVLVAKGWLFPGLFGSKGLACLVAKGWFVWLLAWIAFLSLAWLPRMACSLSFKIALPCFTFQQSRVEG